MKYHLLLQRDREFREDTLDLPVDPEIAWHEFVNLKTVKEFLLLNPNFVLLDVTPESMNEMSCNHDTLSDDDVSLLEHSHDV